MSDDKPPATAAAPRSIVTTLYHALGIVALIVLIVLLNDLRRQFHRTGQAVHDNLPEILEKTRRSTATLARLSEDIRQLRDLAGVTSTPRDSTLAKYADELLDAIEAAPAETRVGTGAIVGSKLKDAKPGREWTVDARKEAVYLAFAASSRAGLLDRLTKTKFGRDWLIQEGEKPPMKLSEWLSAKVSTTQP